MTGAFFNSSTTELFYTSHGAPTSPPILLIHGWACDQLDWVFQIPVLLTLGFYVIALDLRGHGRSRALRSSADASALYSPRTFANDAAALLAHLNLTMPAIVMGHSLGSLVSATLAVEHPEKVRGLVLVDAPYYFTGGVTEQMLAPVRGNLEEAPAKLASSWETLPGVYNERTPEWLKAFHRLRTWGTPANVVVATGEELWGRNESIGKWENAKGYLQKGLGSKTGKERVPRLVVVANDRVNQEKEIGLDTEGAGDRVEVIMDGHWLHQQSAERFNGVVAAWLRGRGFVPSLPT